MTFLTRIYCMGPNMDHVCYRVATTGNRGSNDYLALNTYILRYFVQRDALDRVYIWQVIKDVCLDASDAKRRSYVPLTALTYAIASMDAKLASTWQIRRALLSHLSTRLISNTRLLDRLFTAISNSAALHPRAPKATKP